MSEKVRKSDWWVFLQWNCRDVYPPNGPVDASVEVNWWLVCWLRCHEAYRAIKFPGGVRGETLGKSTQQRSLRCRAHHLATFWKLLMLLPWFFLICICCARSVMNSTIELLSFLRGTFYVQLYILWCNMNSFAGVAPLTLSSGRTTPLDHALFLCVFLPSPPSTLPSLSKHDHPRNIGYSYFLDLY